MARKKNAAPGPDVNADALDAAARIEAMGADGGPPAARGDPWEGLPGAPPLSADSRDDVAGAPINGAPAGLSPEDLQAGVVPGGLGNVSASPEPVIHPRGKGKTAPTRASAVTTASEHLRIYRLTDLGKLEFVGDYTVQEIAQGGDIEGFIHQFIAPRLGGGEYPIYKHVVGGGLSLVQRVNIPKVVAPPVGALAPGVVPPTPSDFLGGMQALNAQIRQEQKDAQERADAEARRRKEELDSFSAVLRSQGESGGKGGDVMSALLLSRMLAPPPPSSAPASDPRVEFMMMQLQQAEAERQRMAAMVSMPPPPPPPPMGPPPPSAMDIATAVAQGLSQVVAPVVGPIVEMIKSGREASASKALTTKDLLELLPAALAAATTAGLIGQKKETGPTNADVALAGVQAKLESMQNQGGGPGETLELLSALVGFTEKLRPKEGASAKDWVQVIDHAIDRAPEIARSFGELAVLQSGGAKMLEGPTGKKIPEALAAGRRDILALPEGEGAEAQQDAAIKVIKAVIPVLGRIHKAGGAWKTDVEAVYKAAVAEDTAGVREALARLVLRAWGKGDEKAKAFFQRVVAAWEKFPAQIAQAISGGEKKEEAVEGSAADLE